MCLRTVKKAWMKISMALVPGLPQLEKKENNSIDDAGSTYPGTAASNHNLSENGRSIPAYFFKRRNGAEVNFWFIFFPPNEA